MGDLVQMQEDVGQALRSCDRFDDFNVVLWRRMKLANLVDFRTIWNTASPSGKVGAGLLVEMPVFDVPHPDVPGPWKEVTLSVVAMEQPDVNFSSGGSQVSAEELAELSLEFLHHSNVAGPNVMVAARPAIVPTEDFKGLVAYRVLLLSERPKVTASRAAAASYGLIGTTVTLTPTAGTDAWYTLDGSFPSRGLDGSTATAYTAPFTVASGQTVRWAAYKDGLFPSHVGQKLIA